MATAMTRIVRGAQNFNLDLCDGCGLPAFRGTLDFGLCDYCANERRTLIDEAVRRTSDVLCVNLEKLVTLLGERVLRAQVAAQFRMLTGQIEDSWMA